MKRKYVIVTAILLLMISLIGGCGNKKNEVTAEEMLGIAKKQKDYVDIVKEYASEEEDVEGKTFFLCYADAGNLFYRAIEIQLKTYMRTDGNILFIKDAKGDAELQKEQVKRAVNEGVDGIFLIPVNLSVAEELAVYLNEQHVPMVLMDAEIDMDNIQTVSIVSDDFNAGYILGEEVEKNMADSLEKRAILVFSQEGEHNISNKSYGITSGLGDVHTDFYEKIELPREEKKAKALIREALKSYSKVNCIFCTNDTTGLQVLSVCDEMGIKSVELYSIDGSDKMKKKLAEGDQRIKGLALQSPFQMSAIGMDVMYALLTGKPTEEKYMVETLLLTEENITDYSVDTWQ